jgi:hypothetical protein
MGYWGSEGERRMGTREGHTRFEGPRPCWGCGSVHSS